MLLSNMNLQIGNVRNYNNKILISSPSFNIGTNLKINLDGEKDKSDIKSNEDHKQDIKPDIKSNKEYKPITDSNKDHKPDIKLKQDIKPNTDSNKEHKPDIKFDKIAYEEEKVALVLRITSIFTVWWMFK